jgi:hypothetical protein
MQKRVLREITDALFTGVLIGSIGVPNTGARFSELQDNNDQHS